jgi:hypothetical protein
MKSRERSRKSRRHLKHLGHESTTTTHRYVDADLAMKEKALALAKNRPTPPCIGIGHLTHSCGPCERSTVARYEAVGKPD